MLNILNYESNKLTNDLFKDPDILTLENIINKWKLQFSENYIKNIKVQNNIEENKTLFEVISNKNNKTLEYEYLYSSQDYLQYFNLEIINSIDIDFIIELIKQINPENISMFGIDEEIDYTI